MKIETQSSVYPFTVYALAILASGFGFVLGTLFSLFLFWVFGANVSSVWESMIWLDTAPPWLSALFAGLLIFYIFKPN